MSEPLMSEILSESEDGLQQVRLTVNEFRGVQYLHLREYYLDFEEEWLPTPKGLAMPITIQSVVNLFDALVKLLSRSDVLNIVLENANQETQDLLYEFLSNRTSKIAGSS